MNNIRELFVPFEDFTSVGGPGGFMRNLKFFLDKQDISYTKQLVNAGILYQ